MRHLLLSYTVFFCCSVAAAQIPAAEATPSFTEQALPRPVQEALRRHYQIGRYSYDVGGVKSVRLFHITPKMNLTQILLQVAHLKKPTGARESDVYLADYCQDKDDGLGVLDLQKCVALLVTHKPRPYFLPWLHSMVVGSPHDVKEALFVRANNELETYIRSLTGNSYVEYMVSLPVWSVDCMQSIILTPEKNLLLLINYDFGA